MNREEFKQKLVNLILQTYLKNPIDIQQDFFYIINKMQEEYFQ